MGETIETRGRFSNAFLPCIRKDEALRSGCMRRIYDAMVVGLGAMGSATLYHLARAGLKVLGVDQFSPPHEHGSSHGQTRIIREAYFEHPIYVPMVQRALELWKALEQESGSPVYLQTGGIMIGAPESIIFTGAQRSAELHRLPFEILNVPEIQSRFPALRPEAHMRGLLEPRAGILFPENCVRAHLELARKHGAGILTGVEVRGWHADSQSVTLATTKGSVTGQRVIICGGPWMPELLPELQLQLTVERQVLHWFAPKRAGIFDLDRCPVHLWEYAPGLMFYGFPNLGRGVKVAIHHQGLATTASDAVRTAWPEDETKVRSLVDRFLPEASGPLLASTVCLYTNTTNGHFILDHHPHHRNVLVASPCSGHGFKFASVIGEILAALATDRDPGFDLALFRLARSTQAPPTA